MDDGGLVVLTMGMAVPVCAVHGPLDLDEAVDAVALQEGVSPAS